MILKIKRQFCVILRPLPNDQAFFVKHLRYANQAMLGHITNIARQAEISTLVLQPLFEEIRTMSTELHTEFRELHYKQSLQNKS